MKRSWQEKIGPEGEKLLDSYRKLNELYQREDFRTWEDRGNWEATELKGQPVPSRVKLTIHLLDLAAGMPPHWKRSVSKLGRVAKPGATCLVVESTPLHYVARLLKRMQFGLRPLSFTEKKALAAQCFELCAQVCRGKLTLPKGRADLERGELVNLIFVLEKQRLTWEDMLEAVRYAGGDVREEPEALRLWVWRNQKKRGGIVLRRKRRR